MGDSDAEKGVFWALHTRHLQNGTAPPGFPPKIFYLEKMVKSARKSETETFWIVGQFHRFEDLAGKRVYVPILNIQKTKQNKTWIWGKNGQKET